MMSIKKRVGGVAAAAIIVVLAGCSGSGSGAGGASSSEADPAAAVADSAGDRAGDSGSAGGESASRAATDSQSFSGEASKATGTGTAPGSALPAGAQVVRTASQTVRVDDVRAAAARARTTATSLGGYVAAENITLGDDGGGRAGDDGDGNGDGDPKPIYGSRAAASSSMTLRVPQKSTDTALDRLAAIGAELNRTSTADDVTAQVADLDSRVQTQERSVKRVRELLDRASSLKDVVLLESELSRREAELEAAQARYKALDDQATLATINLALVSDDSPVPAEDDDGFLHGLTEGWDALGRSTVAVLTGVGAVLPFAVLLGLVGVPVFVAWRRRRPGQPSVGPTTPAAPVEPSAPVVPVAAPVASSTPSGDQP